MTDSPRNRIGLFLLLTFGFSSIFYYLIISAGSMRGWLVTGLMWCPGIAAILCRLALQRNLRGQGWGLGKGRYWLWAYGLPLLLAGPVYAIVWLSGLGDLSSASYIKGLANWSGIAGGPGLLFLWLGTVGVLFGLRGGVGEEIGWRGYLVPELAKHLSFDKVALISGALWSLYHYPILIFADYNSGAPTWYALLMFTLMVFGASYVFAWLRLASGSLWPAALLHATHNLFIQGLFNPLTVDTGITEYVIGEFGIGLVIAYAIAALLVRRAYLRQPVTIRPVFSD